MKKKKSSLGHLISTLLVIAFALLFVLPLIWMFLSSFKPVTEVFGTPFHWLPSEWKVQNYIDVWTDSYANIAISYLNSFFITFTAVVASIAIASFAAYGFAMINFKGKNFVFLLFLASMMVPAQVTIIPTYMLFKTIGLYDSLWSVSLPMWFNCTAIFMLRQFYLGLPNDLMEAAKIDGAGHFRIFSQIMMPLTKSAMISQVVLGFISSWNNYLYPLIFLVTPKKFTIAQVIRYWLLDEFKRHNLTMAAACSAIVPIIILFLCCQKYFVEGIATSGVKG